MEYQSGPLPVIPEKTDQAIMSVGTYVPYMKGIPT